MLKTWTKIKNMTLKRKSSPASTSGLNGSAAAGLNLENGDSSKNQSESVSDIVVHYDLSRSEECLKNGDTTQSPFTGPSSTHSLPTLVDLTPSKPKDTSISAESLLENFTTKHADEDRLFRAEFESITSFMKSLKQNFEHGKAPENKEKNRYRNIISCDESRVVLSTIEGEAGSDYINASYIDGYNSPNKFIAAQGPKENTVNDFWRMVWEQRCYVIVMITELREVGRQKCEKYWPDEGSMEFGVIKVELQSTFEYGGFTKRLLKVSHVEEESEPPRTVFQFQYRAWPDHGVPKTTSHIFRFRQSTLEAQPQNKDAGPIVVHCSAGVGRTGTYMALDTLLGQLEDKAESDVCSLVIDMRMRRTEMVQSLEQYVLLYKLVKEYHLFGITDVSVAEFDEFYEKLQKIDEKTKLSGFDSQFNLLYKSHPVNKRFGSGQLPGNKNKIRDEEVVSYDHSKVFVRMRPYEHTPLYYNASNLEAYDVNSNLIASQDPFKNTREDFWRVIIDNYVTCVVMLSPLQKEDDDDYCPQYWPDEGSEDFGEITVANNSRKEHEHFVETQLTAKSDHLSSDIAHVHYPEWEKANEPPAQVGEALLSIAKYVSSQLTKKQNNVKSRVLIHCSDGAGRTGVLCALVNLLERERREHRIDVFRAVKDLRDCRPLMVRTKEQFKLCYDLIKLHLSKRDAQENENEVANDVTLEVTKEDQKKEIITERDQNDVTSDIKKDDVMQESIDTDEIPTESDANDVTSGDNKDDVALENDTDDVSDEVNDDNDDENVTREVTKDDDSDSNYDDYVVREIINEINRNDVTNNAPNEDDTNFDNYVTSELVKEISRNDVSGDDCQ